MKEIFLMIFGSLSLKHWVLFLLFIPALLVLACKPPENLSTKLATQEPLAVSTNNSVSVSIQYMLVYPPSRLRVRLDVSNNSSHTLKWKLPEDGKDDSYIKDRRTGKKYLPLPGQGLMGKIGESFNIDDNRILTAEPGAQGSVFVYFQFIPNTIERFDMVLTGFSFSDTDITWDTSFTDVPFRVDAASGS